MGESAGRRMRSATGDAAVPVAARPALHWAAGAAAVLIVAGSVSAGVMTLSRGAAPPDSDVLAGCGLVKCGSTPSATPAVTPAAVTHGTQTRRHEAATAVRTVQPTAAPAASPHRPRPSGTPAPAPQTERLSVSYQRIWGGQRRRKFRGRLTLTNHGGSAVSGWTIVLSFPGDSVGGVWVAYPGGGSGPFNGWQAHQGSLTLTASQGAERIPAHSSETVTIDARGITDFPAACSLNGKACWH